MSCTIIPTPAGTRFINLNVTPQGQASGVIVQQLA